MKIAVGTVCHESNSFNPNLTRLEEFQLLQGNEILPHLHTTASCALQGIVPTLLEKKCAVYPLVFARPHSEGGLVDFRAYREIEKAFVKGIENLSSLDALCLDLHGSMTLEGGIDGEGELLKTLRKLVGTIPIVSSLDLHGMITPAMLANADAFVGYRTAPHVDKELTGIRTAALLLRHLEEGIALNMNAVFLPFLVSGEQSETRENPMRALLKTLLELDKEPHIHSSSLFLGFPWCDVPFNKGAALVVAETLELATEKSLLLGAKLWESCRDFQFTTKAYTLQEAVDTLVAAQDFPFIFADCGDNPGAGGSGTITLTLQFVLEKGLKNIFLGAIADPRSYEKLAAEEEVELELGMLSPDHPLPLRCRGKRKHLGEAKGIPGVLVSISGVDVLVTKEPMMMVDPKDLEAFKVHLSSYQGVILKSGYLDPKILRYAKGSGLLLTPGYTNQVFSSLDYGKLERPTFPLDPHFPLDLRTCLGVPY